MREGTGKDKAGYTKIRFCADQARRYNLQYFWVDTCCIDKSNNNEVSEAINSMFRWYYRSARFYSYLSDVSISGLEQEGKQSDLWESAFGLAGELLIDCRGVVLETSNLESVDGLAEAGRSRNFLPQHQSNSSRERATE